MNERTFVLNFDHISEGRTAEPPGKEQAVVKGKIFMHYQDPDDAITGDEPGALKTCLVVAIEREPLIEAFKDFSDIETAGLKAFDYLNTISESPVWDPLNQYAALVIWDSTPV